MLSNDSLMQQFIKFMDVSELLCKRPLVNAMTPSSPIRSFDESEIAP